MPGALRLPAVAQTKRQDMLNLKPPPAGKKAKMNTFTQTLWIYEKTKQNKTKIPANIGR